jgi:hypothetical protein
MAKSTKEAHTAEFVVAGTRASITIEIADRAPQHQPPYVSFTGDYDGGLGQIDTRLREDHDDDPIIARITWLWGELHMKPLPLSTEHATYLEEARRLLSQLDGARLKRPEIEEEAPDLEDANFSNADDVIDSREVIKRIEELRDYIDNYPDAEQIEDARAELAILDALEQEASGYAADWRYGETLIRDSYFEDYARELAEDIGAIKSDAQWPNNHIDWAAAADALKQDYTEVDYDGVSYWIR